MSNEPKQPIDFAKFLTEKFGLTDEHLTDAEKAHNAIAEKLKADFEARYVPEWVAANKERIESESRAGTYNAVTKRIAREFGLDLDKYKTLEKNQIETMLADAKKLLQTSQDTTREELAAKLQAASEKLAEYEAKVNEIPRMEANVRRKFENELFLKSELDKAIAGFKNLNSLITPKQILLNLNEIAKLEVVGEGDARKIEIKRADGKVYPKGQHGVYTSLADLLENEILKPNNWLVSQPTTPPNTPPVGNGSNQQPKANYGIPVHPNIFKSK